LPGADNSKCLMDMVADPNCCAPKYSASCSGGYAFNLGDVCTTADGQPSFTTVCSPYVPPYNQDGNSCKDGWFTEDPNCCSSDGSCYNDKSFSPGSVCGDDGGTPKYHTECTDAIFTKSHTDKCMKGYESIDCAPGSDPFAMCFGPGPDPECCGLPSEEF